jgi:hypothetical protein
LCTASALVTTGNGAADVFVGNTCGDVEAGRLHAVRTHAISRKNKKNIVGLMEAHLQWSFFDFEYIFYVWIVA